MIPWRLQFSGIRDYGPNKMNLSGADEHILITGPNGAGKSTLSFCMGAVLRSSKVDVSGLKSQNLPDDETWRAGIRFLFKNDGASRIDGPLYIEFRVLCEQPPEQPLKLHYEIHDGDALDALALRQTYRSGDVNKNNFTAYQRVLQYKYKIHPDLYYLIWYQQEVNQFSVMAPEERFRIFSEMHGIDKIQKDWEVSLEGVKEAQESLATATTQQKRYDLELSFAKSNKDRFVNNQRRLQESGWQYARTTHELRSQVAKSLKEMHKYIEDRVFEWDDLADEKQDMATELEQSQVKQQHLHQQQSQTQAELETVIEQIDTKEKQSGELDGQIKSLQTELSDLTEAYQKLPYREAETKQKLTHAQNQVAAFQKREQEQRNNISRIQAKTEHNREAQSHTKAAIQQWKEKSKTAYALLERYTSSHQLKEDMSKQYEIIQSLQQERDAADQMLQTNHSTLHMLERNQIESERQKEAIYQLRQQGIQSYPLRYFVELDDEAKIEQEHVFDAIKYAIFYDASTCQPVNDLYHVSLKHIVPNRSMTALPKWGLKMRSELSDKEQNQAARVLWWIEQFFNTEAAPHLKDGNLVDAQGLRGPQEQETYILSKIALTEQRKRLQKQIQTLSQNIKTLNRTLKEKNDIYQVWNADVHKVKEAEAFLSEKAKQTYRINRLSELKTQFKQLQTDREQGEDKANTYWKKSFQWDEEAKKRQADLDIYEQFGQQREKIDQLHQLEHSLKAIKQTIITMKNQRKQHDDQLETLGRDIRNGHRHIADLKENIEQNSRTAAQVMRQKDEKEEEQIAATKQSQAYQNELQELEHLIPELVKKAIAEERTEQSKFELQNQQNQAKVEFMNARNEEDIDPNAVDNYNTLQSEVARKKDELQAAKNLLEENEERAIENENRLERAIAMHVQKINHLFENYMSMFQFEGRIEYEKLLTKQNRPIFKLFIHVRKEGHRGKLEDVSLKARGGRVGKGVSGGEESLSSLLFALSLLQNLENKASFIVMDEFDSALDESRKAKVFELYAEELQRKLIILSPKGHEDDYYNRFSKAFVVSHNPIALQSTVKGLMIKKDNIQAHAET